MGELPLLGVVLGLVGLVPLVFCGIESMTSASLWALPALIAYAAVILSFVGAVHWGLALAPGAPRSAARGRLVLGAIPALLGWISLLLAHWAGLLVLIGGFIASMAVEALTRHGAGLPLGYLWLRFGLSVVTVAILVTVLVLRLIGATITL